MHKAALAALVAAPFLAAGAGVVVAKGVPFWPFRLLERGFAPGEAGSSCVAVEAAPAPEAYPEFFATSVDGRLDPWRVEVSSQGAECRRFDVLDLLGRAQCEVRAPAAITYRNAQEGERRYVIETIGAHRVRASRHGVSCRPLMN